MAAPASWPGPETDSPRRGAGAPRHPTARTPPPGLSQQSPAPPDAHGGGGRPGDRNRPRHDEGHALLTTPLCPGREIKGLMVSTLRDVGAWGAPKAKWAASRRAEPSGSGFAR